jgi:predicted Zn-dependent protease
VISPEKRLAYAVGYLSLDLHAEARAELVDLPPEFLTTPPPLQLRIEIAMAGNAWAEVVELAPDLVAADNAAERPWIAWAYALRELQRIPEAQEILLTGRRLITDPGPIVDYNLACYACLLGELAEARALLADVCARDPAWREIALADSDLDALGLGPA